MDIVYPVRDGDDNEALRYSLRSLQAHAPHDRVWIVGHRPGWLRNVEYISGNYTETKPQRVYENVLRACEHPQVSSRAVFFNDDFFVTAPIDQYRTAFRCRLTEHLSMKRIRDSPDDRWSRSMYSVAQLLDDLGIDQPLSYELHIPLPVDTKLMAETLRDFAHVTPETPPQWRTLYGNINRVGGVKHGDVKRRYASDKALPTPFYSLVNDDPVPEQITTMFPEPSRYECADNARRSRGGRRAAVLGAYV